MHLCICDVIKVPLRWSISQTHTVKCTHTQQHPTGEVTRLWRSVATKQSDSQRFLWLSDSLLSLPLSLSKQPLSMHVTLMSAEWHLSAGMRRNLSRFGWNFPNTHTHENTASSQLLSLFAATRVSTKCDAILNITLIFISASRDHTSVSYSPTRHCNPSRYVYKKGFSTLNWWICCASHAAERSSSTLTFHTAQSW